MTATERRAALGLASIFAVRMLGLFMILPVFTLYAHAFPDYTPLLVGLAIGAYGLTQALLQVPFGMLSDRIGRKPVITAGLLIFALGSVVAAMSHTLIGVVIGRAVQGAGAVAAAIMALTADLTREEHRTKAMAIIGMSIGLSFSVALVSGPLVGNWLGLSGIFWLTAALAVVGLAILHLGVPTPSVSRFHRDTEAAPGQFRQVLKDTQLLRLDVGILILHMVMTSTFVVLPLVLRDQAGLPRAEHWEVYLGVLVTSVVLMVPFIIIAEKHRRMKQVFVGAIVVVGLAQFGLLEIHRTLLEIVALMVGYFAAFNILEASLPSLVSKVAPPQSKGTAMGVYSTSQFLGAFLGGSSGGWMLGHHGPSGVFALNAVLAGAWFVLAATMRSPRYLASQMINVGVMDDNEARLLASKLIEVTGVAEAVVVAEEGIAYLKVDRRALDEAALQDFSVAKA